MKIFAIYFIFLLGNGVLAQQSRIIGGVEANPEDDFVVMIRNIANDPPPPFEGYVSTGVVITSEFVLTVAQAVENIGFAVEVKSINGNGINFVSSNVFVHPEYVSETLQHNIALIKPLFPIIFPVNYIPISLDRGDRPQNSAVYLIFGIGLTDKDNTVIADSVKYTAQLPVSHEQCLYAYNKLVVTESNFCGSTVDNSVPWHGDQGGPVTNFQRELLGIISAFGSEPQYPTVYIDVYAPSEHAFFYCVVEDGKDNEDDIIDCMSERLN